MVDTTEEVKEMGRRKERESREGKKETRRTFENFNPAISPSPRLNGYECRFSPI